MIVIDKLLMNIVNRHPFSLGFSVWRKYISINHKYDKIRYMYGYWYRQNKKSKEPIYFVFRFELPRRGVGAVARAMVFCYNWALKKGVIPIIDLEVTGVYQKGEFGKLNIWDYCFEQMPMDEVMRQDNVFISNISPVLPDKKTCAEINGNKNDYFVHLDMENDYYLKLGNIAKNYLIPKNDLKKKTDEFIASEFKQKKVLGLALREEFSLYPHGSEKENLAFYEKHPIVPTLSESIELINTKLNEWNCDLLFVSTMYEESIIELQKEFGERVIFLPRKRRCLADEKSYLDKFWDKHGDNKWVSEYLQSEEFKEHTITYIEEIMLLAACDCLIAQPGSMAALCPMMRMNKYEQLLFIENRNERNKKIKGKIEKNKS